MRPAAPNATDAPVSAAEFAALLDRLGPFEPAPVIAVAVSGGADSMALAALANHWARSHGGRAIGLTVDHGLRRGSLAEARLTRDRLRVHGIGHHILVWRGPKPASGVQEAARAARYGLLTGWCRSRSVLHLLLAHHRNDQAETVLQRMARASGADGLAAMAAIAERRDVRLLRPCLDVPRARLEATARARRLDWVEDPSNRDPAFARVRLRALAPVLAREGLTPDALSGSARRLAGARAALEWDTARLLARHAVIDPHGYAVLALAALDMAPVEIARRALERLVVCIGGAVHPPRGQRLARLTDALATPGAQGGRTLGGCRLAVRGDHVLIARESARCVSIPDAGGRTLHWDGRFAVRIADRRRGLTLAALGPGPPPVADDRIRALPPPVRAALPALWRGGRPIAVAGIGDERAESAAVTAVFEPLRPAAATLFPVV